MRQTNVKAQRAALTISVLLGACMPKISVDQRASQPEAPVPVPSAIDLGAGTANPMAIGTDELALLAVQPNHGAFSGGQLAILRGNGFTPEARVFFGDQELPTANIQPVDSKRLQIVIPPGIPGTIDVATQNGTDSASRRTLLGGYRFDTFFVAPAVGATAGGTEIHLNGKGTLWDNNTQVYVDLQACTSLRALSPEEIVCTAPRGTSGAKPVRVQTADGVQVDVADAYAYSDSKNNFRGGLSGNALNGKLEVLVFDRNSGKPLNGAVVIGGNGSVVKQVDAAGRASLEGAELTSPQTLTVVTRCYQPITLVDIPVETATVYLDPVLSPACGNPGATRLTGGASIYTESVEGELIWPDIREFQAGGWTNVPQPKTADEHFVAYVFPLAYDPTSAFVLPETYDAVTPSDRTNSGYRFSLRSYPDTLTLYALAGLENRTVNPPIFIPYVMGITPGVKVDPERTKQDVFLQINLPLDQSIRVQVTGPELTARGPNRLDLSVAVGIADQGYIILPGAQRKTLYPAVEALDIVGLPPLVAALSDAVYVAGASAYTGESGGVPRSRGALGKTTLSGQVLALDQFVQIPKLTSPAPNVTWDGRMLAVDWASGGADVDLVVVDISSGAGLVNWRIVLPRGKRAVELPVLSTLSSDLGLVPGSITLKVSSARIDNFQYGSLSYGQLSPRAWTAYAVDVVQGRFAP